MPSETEFVIGLVNTLRAELRTEVKSIQDHIDTTFNRHEQAHTNEENRRNSRLRWFVTTLIAILALAATVADKITT